MFNKVSYRRGLIEGVIIYTLGRLGALITPAFFPDWLYVALPLLAAICFSIDLLVTLTMGLALNMGEVQQGPALWRLFAGGAHHLGITGLAVYELKTVSLLLAIFTIAVVCTRLAQGGFLRFTMPAGGNRVTL